jgi:hypothetical protein
MVWYLQDQLDAAQRQLIARDAASAANGLSPLPLPGGILRAMPINRNEAPGSKLAGEAATTAYRLVSPESPQHAVGTAAGGPSPSQQERAAAVRNLLQSLKAPTQPNR